MRSKVVRNLLREIGRGHPVESIKHSKEFKIIFYFQYLQ